MTKIATTGWNVDRDATDCSIQERRAALAADEAFRAWQNAFIEWVEVPGAGRAVAVMAALDAVNRAHASADEAYLTVRRHQRDAERCRLIAFLDRGGAAGVRHEDLDLLARLAAAVKDSP